MEYDNRYYLWWFTTSSSKLFVYSSPAAYACKPVWIHFIQRKIGRIKTELNVKEMRRDCQKGRTRRTRKEPELSQFSSVVFHIACLLKCELDFLYIIIKKVLTVGQSRAWLKKLRESGNSMYQVAPIAYISGILKILQIYIKREKNKPIFYTYIFHQFFINIRHMNEK